MNTNVQVDQFHGGAAHGALASRLLQANFSSDVLRPWIEKDKSGQVIGCYQNSASGSPIRVNTATLLKDEWIAMDNAIIKVARERLRGIADLQSAGLTFNIGNGLGKTVLQYQDAGDITGASMSMDGTQKGNNDRPEYGIKSLPLPIIHKDFQMNARVLAESRNGSMPLDTTMAELAARKVAEYLEDLLFLGSSSFSYGGGTIYGYTDFPQRTPSVLSYAWDTSSATGATILADVLAMKQASITNRYFGPWIMYIPTAYETVLDDEFKANSDKSIRTRLLEVSGLTDIRVADHLTGDNVLMVQMSTDVVRLVNGLPFQTVQWETDGGMTLHFKVMTIMVPQIRADQQNHCGVIHATTA